ncbi:exodeoxyribonuclease V subunit beta [Gilliamella sp. B2865]|uniref:exodeoxyribonuclease V subunit beta n=1 Tax=unclassified Gilliamella TaxID=2685620 RepID=UPI0022697F7F|nr:MULTISPECIES: exodeoxyribonuclease V subunit beta [unclassified Gilliamella]MCX8670160.1 exodeoxyribonuclease V subunit beta [Gilliamella sp. B2785]MCX8678297.1 exodeoxyribonuclease V subunit beta [Gilliamella sp. B2865]
MVSCSGVKKLNLFDLPLTGRTLIEASAGTGKTYSLAFIYLRLLLGIGKNNYPTPLEVNQILVVTFTKAATQELRSRIRQNIQELRLGLLQGRHEDPIYQQLIDLVEDTDDAIQRLTQAQQSMDDAAIYTIHGFCQRILTSHAFESGVLFEQTLITDEQDLKLQVVQDFWRHYFVPLDRALVYLILDYWQDPKSLLSDINPYLNFEFDQSQEENFDITKKIEQFYRKHFEQIELVKKLWLDSVADLPEIIARSGVNKQSYNNRFLPNWFAKVTAWAQLPTQSFKIPSELTKFSQSILIEKTKQDKDPPVHVVFEKIDWLCNSAIDLRSEILMDIVSVIQKGIYAQKVKLGKMSFDDLLSQLNRALRARNGKRLAQSIAQKYCVALIDEFQDTDPVQYKIFDRIYGRYPESTGLLFIGDPKQAIYSFRGADIFTYLKAKLSTGENNFTMQVNHRSSSSMVDAVNALFSNHDNPFIFENISFFPMESAERNQHKGLIINQREVNALTAYLLPDEVTTKTDYQEHIASCCAKQIVTWLTDPTILIKDKDEHRSITTADIAILVRTGREAEIIQQKLAAFGVKSVYLSNRNSVFLSKEAQEILYLLQAVLMPENEAALRLALMTTLLGQTMAELEQIIDDQDKWEGLIEEFKQYQIIWQYYGVLVMLRRMMKKRKLAENILASPNGERTLTNFMHLGELLQEAADELDSPHALVRWLSRQIVSPDSNIENHEQRLESDENLVKIITIHKSKGLEFPIVWLPFAAQFRNSDSQFYHDKNNDYQPTYAWLLTDDVKQQIEDERLAEDLRLLYVAMTRSIYHCSVGLASLKKSQSAIDYLLKGQLRSIGKFADLVELQLPILGEQYTATKAPNMLLAANEFKRKLSNSWRVTSYTELQKHNNGFNLASDWSESRVPPDASLLSEVQYDIHHFPKGAYVGTLLHFIMENLTPSNADELCTTTIKKLGLDEPWLRVLNDWLQQVLTTKLHQDCSTLASILNSKCINELQFYFPIRHAVTSSQLDSLCKQYDDLSKQCPPLDFETVQGMLKGFIDLVFEYQGKYYIVDYKSNWLGDSIEAYTEQALNQVMCEHRYELQYQLYCLALHRFLRSRLPDYRYETYFGGVYYLFLRGLPDKGIFYHLPKQEFIEKLDKLFDGENLA